jgi:hypothetical protein
MGIKYEVIGTAELQQQIELLKYYPEIFDKHFYPAMQKAAEIVKNEIRPLVPVRTGHLQSALGSKVVHSGTAALGTRAIIGFGKRFTNVSARYNGPLNEGAAPHEVAARREKYLHFSSRGRFTTIRSVSVPGFSGRKYMDRGLQAATPAIDTEMADAATAVINELRAP